MLLHYIGGCSEVPAMYKNYFYVYTHLGERSLSGAIFKFLSLPPTQEIQHLKLQKLKKFQILIGCIQRGEEVRRLNFLFNYLNA